MGEGGGFLPLNPFSLKISRLNPVQAQVTIDQLINIKFKLLIRQL